MILAIGQLYAWQLVIVSTDTAHVCSLLVESCRGKRSDLSVSHLDKCRPPTCCKSISQIVKKLGKFYCAVSHKRLLIKTDVFLNIAIFVPPSIMKLPVLKIRIVGYP